MPPGAGRGDGTLPDPKERDIHLGELGEFGLIERIAARVGSAPAVLLGPGDDAAVLRAADGRVVATMDLLVEGRHFRRDFSPAYAVGRRAAAANLADVVAMGATPTALLVGFGAPADLPVAWAEELVDGLVDEARGVGAGLAGGDVVRAPQVLLAVTALGELGGRAPLTRAGARPGELLVLVGRTGRAAAGLALLQAGERTGELVRAHQRPDPPYATALELAARASAMIDVSDGLLADVGHLAAASGVGIDIDTAAVPLGADLLAAADRLGAQALDWALTGGDDHAFAATVPAAAGPDLPAAAVVIGRVRPGAGVRVDGQLRPGAGGHDHFRSG